MYINCDGEATATTALNGLTMEQIFAILTAFLVLFATSFGIRVIYKMIPKY